MKQPDRGTALELDDDVFSYSELGELINFDFEEGLDEPDALMGNVWPAVVIGGDLVIDGDVCSKDLAAGLEGFTGKYTNGHLVIVLGNLQVRGNLEVEQYFDLIVAGDVDVHSYRSHSANFVATGQLRARDIICTEANEEGGVFRPGKASAQAWVWVGYYYDDEVDFEGLIVDAQEFHGASRDRALHAVCVALDKAKNEDESLWPAMVSCIKGGKIARFLEAYENEEQAKGPFDSYDGPLRRLHISKGQHDYNHLVGLWTEGREVVAVGGFHTNRAFSSDNNGKSFSSFSVSLRDNGLRSILHADGVWWVCGAKGLLGRSTNRSKFKHVQLREKQCFQTVLAADDALWVTGDPGAYRSEDRGKTWNKLEELEGEICRPQDSVHGVLLPSDKGHLYLCKGGAITKTGLKAPGSPWAATCTKEGTILVVCSEGKVHRSTDAGASFSSLKTSAPGSLENIVALDDGRIVAVGEGGAVLESTDDGVSFTRHEHPFTKKWIFGIRKWSENTALLVGENGMILAYE
jgi:photosystem II stability/assembly factor-like uncharacterized protein